MKPFCKPGVDGVPDPKEVMAADPLICVDMGTTNTRVWALSGGNEVLAEARAQLGVGDTAREGSNRRLKEGLRELIRRALSEARASDASFSPGRVVAAGMIASPLGLLEVPHVPAPAGLRELAGAVQSHAFPDVTDLPVLFIPGVRCGPPHWDRDTVGAGDVIRGEETLCVGLVQAGVLRPPALLVNLGSHWKVIALSADGRIVAGVTSLSGEMIHALQLHTILADALPSEPPSEIHEEWLKAGMREERRSGLPRALFCVRLLEQSRAGGPGERLSFAVGAFLAADLDGLQRSGLLEPGSSAVVAGRPALAAAWASALASAGLRTVVPPPEDLTRCLLGGFRAVAAPCRGRSGLPG